MNQNGIAALLNDAQGSIYSAANINLLCVSILQPLISDLTLQGLCVANGERNVPQPWVIPAGTAGVVLHPAGGRTGGGPLSYALRDRADIGKAVVSFTVL